MSARRPGGRLRSLAPASESPWVAAADRHTPALAAEVARLLAALAREVPTTRFRTLATAGAPAVVAGYVAPEVVHKATTTGLQAALATAAGAAFTASFGANFDQVNPWASDWARDRAGELVAGINDETRQVVAELTRRVIEGLDTVDDMARVLRALIGLTPAQAVTALRYRDALRETALRDARGQAGAARLRSRFALSPWRGGPLPTERINALFGQYVERQRRWRTEMIARTETMMAAMAGDAAAWDERLATGWADGMVVTREWSVTRDDRACDICLKLDGRQLTVGPINSYDRILVSEMGDYGNGLQHPPAHPSCRCVIITTLEPSSG